MGKLLKYEFRALWRVFVPCWVAILGLGLLNSFSLWKMSETPWAATVGFSTLLIYLVAIIGALVVAFIFMINRFYKGLLKGNGYLMFTLPVSTDSLIWSKAIAAVILFAGTALCLLVSLFLLIRYLPVRELAQAGQAIWNYFNGQGVAILVGCGVVGVLILIAATFAGVFQCYLSMSIGHLANKGRGVLSILAFIGIETVKSSVGNALTVSMATGSALLKPVTEFLGKATDQFVALMQGTQTQMATALGMVLVVLFVILLVQAIEGLIYFLFTRLILNRRLNLQ